MTLKSLGSAQNGEATWRRLIQICEVAVWLYCVPGNIQCVKLDRGQRLYQIVFCRKDQSIPCNSTGPSRLYLVRDQHDTSSSRSLTAVKWYRQDPISSSHAQV